MKILAIGSRMREYPRNVVLLDVLAGAHHTKECDLPKGTLGVVLAILWTERSHYDAVLILQPTKTFVFPVLFAKLFWRGRVIGDAFTSLYDTFVNDRALAGRWSIKALYYFLLDWTFVHLCDTLLFDTEEHRVYFSHAVGLGSRRSVIVPVSVDIRTMERVEPAKLPHAKEGKFQVLFAGYFIPLQGIEHIIAAADILRVHAHIHFTLLGAGQTRLEMEERARALNLTNLTFMRPVHYPEYLAYIKGADLSLGVFGSSRKASRVVPNKVVEAAALGVPVVTGRSAPLDVYFKDGESVFFANMADPSDLAKSILRACNTEALRAVGLAGQSIARQSFSKENLHNILKTL